MELNTSEGQFGDGDPGGAKQVRLRPRAIYQTDHRIILIECSNPFNSVKLAGIFKELAYQVPALNLLVET